MLVTGDALMTTTPSAFVNGFLPTGNLTATHIDIAAIYLTTERYHRHQVAVISSLSVSEIEKATLCKGDQFNLA
eukprot:4394567-Prorocentrum_lima.AAC.1